MQKRLIIFQDRIAEVGGVETHLYNLCLALRNYYDILVLYGSNPKMQQVRRLLPLVDVEHYDKNKTYECDICLRNSLSTIIPENIKAKRYIEMMHADYVWLKKKRWLFEFWNKAEKLGCGEFVAKRFKEAYGVDIPYIRNILAPKIETSKVYHFISATRLGAYKGYDRILEMIDMLRKANIKFTWDIFTDSPIPKDKPEEIRVWSQRFNMFDYVADADYTILLSDAEGLPYTVQESLQYGTPCIVTDIGGCTELIKDGVNGYVVPLNMDFDINIIKKIPKFPEYKGTDVKEWLEYLGDYEYIEKPIKEIPKMKIKVIKEFKNKDTGKKVPVGSIFECDDIRANNIVSLKYGELIEEPKKKEKEIVVEELKA